MRPARGKLAWRLYLLGLMQLGILAAAAVFVASQTQPPPPPRHLPRPVLAAAAERARDVIGDRPALARELDALREQYNVDLTVWIDGQPVASNVEPPLTVPPGRVGPPPFDLGPPDPRGPGRGPPGPRRGGPDGLPPDGPGPELAVHLGSDVILVARWIQPPPPWLGPLVTLLVGIALAGVGAFLTARWIVRPIEALSRTAQAVGEGNLEARTGLDRNDELGRLGRGFDEMAERVQRLVEAERELLANVSHELRTPLARIRVAMDLAAEGDAEAVRTSLADIAVDLAELEAIVDDVITATHFEVAGRGSPRAGLPVSTLQQLNPRVLAERAEERFRARHPDRPLEVKVAADVTTVYVDPVLFRRVLDNLLENAHKYTTDSALAVSMTVARSGEDVAFEIADRGIGIAAEDLPHVFQPFYRADRSRSRGAGGVGLGLTLAKRIVEAHGGSINVASEPGQGTTVRVVVPGLEG